LKEATTEDEDSVLSSSFFKSFKNFRRAKF